MAGRRRDVQPGDGPPAPARLGRRPGVSRTREAIVEAARTEFAAKGYDRTTFRAVAARAGVDPMLVVHYFKNKDGLFEAALTLPHDLPERWLAVTGGPLETLGPDLAAFYLGLWDTPETAAQMRALVASAVSNDVATDLMRELVSSRLLVRLAERLPGPDPEVRAGLLASHLVGVAMLRYVVQVPTMVQPATGVLVARLGPVLQAYVAAPA